MNELGAVPKPFAYAHTILRKSPQVLERFQDKYRYICADESQDTSKIQHAIIKLLTQKHGNIFMVGDEDQSTTKVHLK